MISALMVTYFLLGLFVGGIIEAVFRPLTRRYDREPK